jgi:DNA-binding response OmpR family regulator
MPSASSSNGEKEAEAAAAAVAAARAGGPRSDFLSHLDRRLGELRTYLRGLEQEPGSPRLRDDLRRRVHALLTGARHLRFAGMAAALAETERLLERAAAVGGLDPVEIAAIGARLDEIPKLTWIEPTPEPKRTEPPPRESIGKKGGVPPSVLVVGPSGVADAIANPLEHGLDTEIECERTESTTAALDMVRALAPDVVVVDVDLPGAKELVSKLTRDVVAQPLPIVVVGTWGSVEDGARWVAAGASRAMPKPVSPHGLRKACVELGSAGPAPVQFAPMGQATVEDLTARIVSEVKRGLEDAVVAGKSTPVLLGDGSDILAAVWGALARVRDLMMIKSGGMVRFSAEGPEGALPIAPWGGEGSGFAETFGGQRAGDARREEPVALEGRKVVVADDDPAVTWFIGGVLRAVGADVREAHDGKRALEVCFRFNPEVVISDILMPGLDGFALCRALKRDIALRDVPVILLSWKEDLLQRVRDLGADADGYLRKEASAAAILERVRQVVSERVRLEARLKSEGEVRGRLDGVTPRTLLDAVSRLRPDGRVRIRDASFLYEMEIRGGWPKSATRTTSDGSFQRGRAVVAALLGVRTGRFVVSRGAGPVRGMLEGDLENQMEEPIARARAAMSLLGGARLLEVHRVDIARDQVEPYLSATPDPARSLVVRLAEGASPRDLVLHGDVAPAELDHVLGDLAAHGAIVAIRGANDVDLLGAAFSRELAVIRKEGPPSVPVQSAPPFHRPAILFAREAGANPEPVVAPEANGAVRVEPVERAGEARPTGDSDRVNEEPAGEEPAGDEPARHEPARDEPAADAHQPFELRGVRESTDSEDEDAPSSLEAAVIRQLSEPTPLPGRVGLVEDDRSIMDASELKARSPSVVVASDPPMTEPSLPPDAIIPGSASDERIQAARPSPSIIAAESAPPPVAAPAPATAHVRSDQPPQNSDAPRGGAISEPYRSDMPGVSDPTSLRPPMKRGSGFAIGALVALGTLGLFIAVMQYSTSMSSPREAKLAQETLPMPTTAPATGAVLADSAGAAAPSALAHSQGDLPEGRASAVPAAGEEGPLPHGVVIGAGQGLLDVETGDRVAVFVDGVELGRGPFVRLTLAPGVHEVRLHGASDQRGTTEVRGTEIDRVRQVTIHVARRTRLLVSSTWTR